MDTIALLDLDRGAIAFYTNRIGTAIALRGVGAEATRDSIIKMVQG